MATRNRATDDEEHEAHPDRDHSIGVFVRARRRGEHLSQRELAELAGVGPRVVVELEQGKPTLRMDVVNAVLRVFGKSLGVVDAVRPEEPD
jgi:y4mF family transcriptional regulator